MSCFRGKGKYMTGIDTSFALSVRHADVSWGTLNAQVDIITRKLEEI